jgi:hypothetical protein
MDYRRPDTSSAGSQDIAIFVYNTIFRSLVDISCRGTAVHSEGNNALLRVES